MRVSIGCMLLGLCWSLPIWGAESRVCSQKTGQAAVHRVGLAQVSITPKQSLTMGGYGTYYLFPALTRHNDIGVHDPIFASTFWIEDDPQKPLAIVSLDLVGLSAALVESVRESALKKLGKPGLQLILSATHTHQSPDVLGLWGAIPFSGQDPDYMRFLEAQILASLQSAADQSRCATLSWVETQKPTTWHERIPKAEKLEKVLTLIVETEDSGQILGTFTQWAAHPTLLHAGNNSISSDFPGTFRFYMGQRIPGVHIYVNGMLGASYIPLDESQARPDPFAKGDQDPDSLSLYERVAFHGHDLADRVLKAMQGPRQGLMQKTLALQSKRFTIPLNNFLFRLAETLGMLEPRGLASGTMRTEIARMRIGELQILTVPGEIFPDGAQKLLQAAEGSGPVMLIGIANDWVGYLLNDEENLDAHFAYHRKLSPHPDATQHILAAYKELLQPLGMPSAKLAKPRPPKPLLPRKPE